MYIPLDLRAGPRGRLPWNTLAENVELVGKTCTVAEKYPILQSGFFTEYATVDSMSQSKSCRIPFAADPIIMAQYP